MFLENAFPLLNICTNKQFSNTKLTSQFLQYSHESCKIEHQANKQVFLMCADQVCGLLVTG